MKQAEEKGAGATTTAETTAQQLSFLESNAAAEEAVAELLPAQSVPSQPAGGAATETAAQAEIVRLRTYIEKLNDAYYDQDTPLLSDAEYDLLLRHLKELEAAHPQSARDSSPTQKVGGKASRHLPKVAHERPMLSLQDVFSLEEVAAFTAPLREQFPDLVFSVEQKIDGLSLGLRYRDGAFTLAHTRGDGHLYGENVSEQARYLRQLPLFLAEALPQLEVRAECYLPYADFQRVNQELEASGRPLMVNPRNGAAGTLRQLQAELVGERGLAYFAFDILQIRGKSFQSDTEGLEWLAEQGFTVIPQPQLCRTDEEIFAAIRQIGAQRNELPYGIDGAVVKVDDLSIRKKLGASSKVPRWAVAYKYPPETKITTLESIDVQVGRTGRLTPLAHVTPVLLSGSTVSKASLHNAAMVESMDLHIGDQVAITKSGDIIPYILRALPERRPQGAVAWHMPDSCPVCGAPVAPQDDSVDLYCTGPDCPAKLSAQLSYFASQTAMNIAGLGEQSVERLKEAGFLKHLPDIYGLSERREELIASGIIGREKRVDHLLEEIERSRHNPLWRLLTGLGIRFVGPETARALTRHFSTMAALQAASRDELLSVDSIGERSADAILAYFALPQTQDLLEAFARAGVALADAQTRKETEMTASGSPSPLMNKKVVITGTLPGISRSQAVAWIEAQGGSVSASVSQKTDYLLLGEAPGSKAEKARELGIPALSWEEMQALVQTAG